MKDFINSCLMSYVTLGPCRSPVLIFTSSLVTITQNAHIYMGIQSKSTLPKLCSNKILYKARLAITRYIAFTGFTGHIECMVSSLAWLEHSTSFFSVALLSILVKWLELMSCLLWILILIKLLHNLSSNLSSAVPLLHWPSFHCRWGQNLTGPFHTRLSYLSSLQPQMPQLIPLLR